MHILLLFSEKALTWFPINNLRSYGNKMLDNSGSSSDRK